MVNGPSLWMNMTLGPPAQTFVRLIDIILFPGLVTSFITNKEEIQFVFLEKY